MDKALLAVFLVSFTVVNALDVGLDDIEDNYQQSFLDKRTACSDRNTINTCRRYKNWGYCSGSWMRSNCAKTCGHCSSSSSCTDKRPRNTCMKYKNWGHCSGSWMRSNCAKTCGHCSTGRQPTTMRPTRRPTTKPHKSTCSDRTSKQTCLKYKNRGYCSGSWMKRNCRKTCGRCSTATRPTTKRPTRRPTSKRQTKTCNKRDKRQCPFYKSKGYCSRSHQYYSWMTSNCAIACGICQRPTTKVGKNVHLVKVNRHECLKAHNDYRRRHGAAPLTWDPKLAKDAQNWALHLATIKTLKHVGQHVYQGENLAQKYWQGLTCKDATKEWYDEVKHYSFSNPPRITQGDTGHFTQVVWKSTKRLGVGIAKNGPYTFLVARYYPPGNVYRKFAKNVGRPVGR